MKPELLAPAGNWTMLNTAINAGADSVYFGIKGLNMRASAENFTLNDLNKISELPIKKYLALNTIIFDSEINKIKKIIEKAKNKVDAIICWDLAVLNLVKKYNIPIHISTQASVANSEAAKFYKEQGAERIILARELNLKQIKEIKRKVKIELETFVHGAQCISISGRCFLSHELFNKSANRGECLQPCRRIYTITDENNKLKLGRDYILSAKDLCLLPYLEKLKAAKIDAFKIEGRSRSIEYVDSVVKAYRKAIDTKLDKNLINDLMEDLKEVYNRKFSTGFYFGKFGKVNDVTDISGNAAKGKIEIGKVVNFYKKNKVASIKLTSSGLKLNDEIIVIGNKTGIVRQKISSLEINHNRLKKAKKNSVVAVKFDKLVRENDLVFKK